MRYGSEVHHQILVETHDERSVDSTVIDLDMLAMLMVDVFSAQGVPAGSESSLTLADPEYMAQLKEEFLDGDGSPTDVLSFPIDGPTATEMEDHEGTVMLGDVVICPAVAVVQASEHTGSIEDEMALLVVHGCLHLLGWDHADPEERARMWTRERELLVEYHRLPVKDPWCDTSGDRDGN